MAIREQRMVYVIFEESEMGLKRNELKGTQNEEMSAGKRLAG